LEPPSRPALAAGPAAGPAAAAPPPDERAPVAAAPVHSVEAASKAARDRREASAVKPRQPAESGGDADAAMVPPVLRDLPQPRLPPLAERQRREAVILVRVLVDEQGRVVEAEVQDDDPQRRIFFQEALRVARAATFEPGTRHGVAARMHSTIPVQFRLRR
jgi:protein TonB